MFTRTRTGPIYLLIILGFELDLYDRKNIYIMPKAWISQQPGETDLLITADIFMQKFWPEAAARRDSLVHQIPIRRLGISSLFLHQYLFSTI